MSVGTTRNLPDRASPESVATLGARDDEALSVLRAALAANVDR
jgi:hypothetical protein